MNWIIEPLIGGVIGCFTNYIAILMLFRPYEEIKIGKFKIPFTPGIVPKRKPEIARVIGMVVQENLIDTEQIANSLTSEPVSEKIIENIYKYEVNVDREHAEKISQLATEVIRKFELEKIIASEAKSYITKKFEGNFLLAKFINESMMTEVASMIEQEVKAYLETDGKEKISQMVSEEIDGINGYTVENILFRYEIDENDVAKGLKEKYREIVNDKCDSAIEAINIAQIIENKINEMSMKELEEMVLKVMKNELQAIVILGMFIGFIIGLVNLLV